MEEILASIRRIIADDRILPLSSKAGAPLSGESALPPPAESGPQPAATSPAIQEEDRSGAPRLGGQRRGDIVAEARRPASSDIRSLRILSGQSGTPPPANSQAVESDDFFAAEASEAAFPLQPPPPRQTPPDPLSALVFGTGDDPSPSTEADPILSDLADASVASSFQSLATTVFLQNSGFVEQSVRDMLRPLLKQWLDEHLPTIVERLVRAEIERVARGGRR